MESRGNETGVKRRKMSTKLSFVTLPFFAIKGAHFRIQANSADFHWTPLVTDETREEWEKYAHENRFHKDRDYDFETSLRSQQDEEFQLDQHCDA